MVAEAFWKFGNSKKSRLRANIGQRLSPQDFTRGIQDKIVRRRRSACFDFSLMRFRTKVEHASQKGVLATLRQAKTQ
jgi:hypothetical protein